MKDLEGILVGIGLLFWGVYMKLLEYKIIFKKEPDCDCEMPKIGKLVGWFLIMCGITQIILSLILKY
jgi:hypothetical protein